MFYEQLFENFDALQTLGESDMFKGFVLTTLNKLPQINQTWCEVEKIRRTGGWKIN